MTVKTPVRHFGLWLIAILALHCLVVWVFRYTSITFGDDDAGYLLLAKSLSQLQYRELQEIGAPLAVHYPPGYPAVLAIWRGLVGDRLPLLILLNVGFSAATLGLFAAVVRRLWTERLALALTLVLSLSMGVGFLPGRIMSEPLFDFLLMVSLWALHDHPERVDRFALSTGATVLAALVRSAGAAMLAGLFAYWLWRRKWTRAGIFALSSLVTVGAWFAWSLRAPEAESRQRYVGEFMAQIRYQTQGVEPSSTKPLTVAQLASTVAVRAVKNSKYYLAHGIPSMLSLPTMPGTVVDNIGWLVVVVLSLTVGIAVLAAAWLPSALILISYGALLAVWPVRPDRLLAPVVPLMMLSVFLMVKRLTRRRVSETAVTWTLVSVLVLGQLIELGRQYQASFGCGPSEKVLRRCINAEERAMLRLTEWLRDSLPSGARLMSTKERPVYLLSGHQLVNFRAAVSIEPPDAFLSHLRSNRVDYVVLTSLGYLVPTMWRRLRESCTSLAVARFERPDAFAFRLRQPFEETDSSACRALDDWVGPKRMTEEDPS